MSQTRKAARQIVQDSARRPLLARIYSFLYLASRSAVALVRAFIVAFYQMVQSKIQISSSRRGRFRITELALEIPNLPDSFNEYRLAQLSDIHLGPATPIHVLEEAVETTTSLKPDLVLLTGDYVQLSSTKLRHFFAHRINPKVARWLEYKRSVRSISQALGTVISQLQPRDGLVGIYGNHDYLEGIRVITRQLPQHIYWLKNHSLMIRKKDAVLQLVGLDDLREGSPDLNKALATEYPRPHLPLLLGGDGAYSAKRSDRAFLRILLSHNPDITIHPDKYLLSNVDLVLCGHTHGGQIRLPIVGPVYTRTKQKRHVYGLADCDKTPVFVSAGIGCGVVPFRIFCPPEIVLIRLTLAK